MLVEDPFLLQLAKSIQAWLWVENELYLLYAMFMRGADSHLVSVTFNSVHSVEAKLGLLNSCFTLTFERNGEELQAWKSMRSKLGKLNDKRNKLVHEPVSIEYKNGNETVSLGPSHLNALALAKGQTTHQGTPVLSAEYEGSRVGLLQDHQLSRTAVASLERSFKTTAHEMRAYRESISPKVAAALQASKKRRGASAA